jgi:hypothetical protein
MSASGLTYFAAVLYWTLTSLYGALASQAFVQEQFLAPRLFAPLAHFADWHAPLGFVLLVGWIAPRWNTSKGGRKALVFGAASIWILSTAFLALRAPLADLKTTSSALMVVSAGVLGLLALAAAEVQVIAHDRPGQSGNRSGADLAACLLAAAGIVVIDLVSSAAFGVSTPQPGDVLSNIRLHLLLAGTAFLTLAAVRAAAALLPWPAATELWLSALVLAAAISSYLFAVALHSISLGGRMGMAIAAAIGVSLACALSARATASRAESDDGVVSVMRTLAPGMTARWWGFGVWIAMLAGVAASVSAASRQADWSFVLLHTGVVSTWLLALAGALVLSARFASGGAPLSFAAAALLLGGHMALQVSAAPLQSASQLGASAKWLAGALDTGARTEGVSDFVRLLLEHTNIPRDVHVDPIDVTVATLDGVPAASRPHVFVFVIDSLRRDYVSSYNPAVTFTPSIAELASDSLVFRNAFTQYGATGLSVPALWVGGPILHKQYVMPFAPMNSLAKLLAHEGYAQWIGMDNIMEAILPASADRQPLDQGVAIKDFRACRTLEELRSRLKARAADAPPVFAYALPQDIHISAITREGATAVDGRDYGRFYAPVASRIARLDACLGGFLHDLKASGLYDQSIIVLTADHGDSLGEEGRMGHAYSLHPEIVRVPLIVHLPPALRAGWDWDESRATYTTDLTPTLYRLLGHDVHPPAPFFGESLARPLDGPPAAANRDRMVAASYGAVYGALLDGGTRYYVFDGINMREHAFALGSGAEPGTAVPLTPDLQNRGMKVIRDTVEAIGAFYRFTPAHGADD